MSFKRVFAAAALSLSLVTVAFGQAGIQLGAGQVLGNSTAAQRPGRAESVTAILDRALGSTRGAIIERGVAGWAMFSPSATARVPYLSGGAGADPLYGAYTLPASVTSGGVACFTSTTVEASSGALSANAIVLGGGAGVCPSPMGSLGTTTTVLHGNAGGAPSFGAVVSADLSITATNCTNQFVSAISTGGVGTCTTDTLAGPQHANQGTTTTVLHGNAAGNPAFGAVVSADLNITPTTCSSQFVSVVSAGGVGTCSTVDQSVVGSTAFISLKKSAVNFNSANTDTQIDLTFTSGNTRYQIFRLYISHCTQTTTTATVDLRTAAAGGGNSLLSVSPTAVTISTASENTANNAQSVTIGTGGSGGTASINTTPIFFRVVAAQGATDTCDVTLQYHVIS